MLAKPGTTRFSSNVLKDTRTLLQGPRFKPDMSVRVCVCVCEGVSERAEQRGDSRLLKNWWVARGHVSAKSFPAAIHIFHDDFLPSISLHPAAVRSQRLGYLIIYFFNLRQSWLCQDSVCTDQKNGECVFVKGMRGFYGIVQWIIHAEKCLSLLIIQL